MRVATVVRSFAAFLFLSFVLAISPASARRTVIDASYIMTLDGYCSPGAAAIEGCPAQSLPFALTIDGNSYGSYYVNSNGTLSLGSIEAQLAAESTYTSSSTANSGGVYTGPDPLTSMASYTVPIFSPNFVDGPGFASNFLPPFEFDGAFAAETTTTASSLSVIWYECPSPAHCGQATIDALSNPGDQFLEDQLFGLGFDALGCPCDPYPGDEAIRAAGVEVASQGLAAQIFGLTVSQLPTGFAVSYTYGSGWLGRTGTYGYNIPGDFYEVTGPLANRTFIFDSDGQLVAEAPEPATWMTMLLGFGLVGGALRRRKQARAALA